MFRMYRLTEQLGLKGPPLKTIEAWAGTGLLQRKIGRTIGTVRTAVKDERPLNSGLFRPFRALKADTAKPLDQEA